MRWKVPRMWQGGECWILGGGPSLTREFDIPDDVVRAVKQGNKPLSAYSPYMEAIHSKHIIGVNIAFMIGNWIEVMFFGDGGFFLKYRQEIAQYPGLKIGCSPKINSRRYTHDGIKYLSHDRDHPRGISSDSGMVSWNKNSGSAAISVAANMGARRIILVGFDMQSASDHSQHWHNMYGHSPGQIPNKPHKLPFGRHLLGFPQIAKDAKKRGIEIINASPESKIEEFRRVKVKDLL